MKNAKGHEEKITGWVKQHRAPRNGFKIKRLKAGSAHGAHNGVLFIHIHPVLREFQDQIEISTIASVR
jgi:predicted ATP-dependent protease